ncbi:hypothetical protein ACNTMW_26500 [Planosporangium sp. 12N6]|uniref:hypothetical protein n=1 Tax=Planosporangium spinosum TaxID=3402278 RepID=UPI003CEFC69C
MHRIAWSRPDPDLTRVTRDLLADPRLTGLCDPQPVDHAGRTWQGHARRTCCLMYQASDRYCATCSRHHPATRADLLHQLVAAFHAEAR